jgi:predicted secreted hydrolase
MSSMRPVRLVGRPSLLVLGLLVALVAGACSGPVLANPAAPRPTVAPEPTVAPRPADPQAVVFPRDDGPHDRLTEWWYYTGHLTDETGGRWGFEYVIFRAERGDFPVAWASHLALTDETGGRFHYAERSEIGSQVDRSPRDEAEEPAGFDLQIRGLDPARPETFTRAPWTMAGADGFDRLAATFGPEEAKGDPVPGTAGPLGIDLDLVPRKPPALHDDDGYVDFGPAGGSYYYSRTSMDAAGTLTVGDRTLAVDGRAWFDHQWGDFIAVGAGGWDWFAINLDDDTEITLSLVRADDGTYPLVYGSLIEPDGNTRRLGDDAFTVEVTDTWTSMATGTTWPAGWRIELPGEDLVISLEPTVAQQELDTRETTGVVYWEGSQHVVATRDGRSLGGQAYVELTGYAGRD